jgi:hypothetical protein
LPAAWTRSGRLVSFRRDQAIFEIRSALAMTLRALAIAILFLIPGAAMAAPSGARPAVDKMLAPPMVFYVAKGPADACGRGCDSWIVAEGQIVGDTAARFRKFWRPLRDRNLPIYFSSPGGNLEQALAIGAMLREKPVVARVARTVVRECGFEAQTGDVCLKLKQSGRALYGELSARGAMCNSACPYLILGAATREIAPDVGLAIHSPRVILHYQGEVAAQVLAEATARGRDRADRLVSNYLAKMGVDHGLLELARTVKFEDMHMLTREEIVRFGIDRRELVETPWTLENNARSMVHKSAIETSGTQKNGGGNSYRLVQWRLICSGADRFELDFQRPAAPTPGFDTVAISSDGPKQFFASPPYRTAGLEVWGLRVGKEKVEAFAGAPEFDFTETSLASDGRRLAHSEKLSTEGLASALGSLVATCPAPKDAAPLQTSGLHDSAAK